MGKVAIYDTTLRDGMQAEGISFSLEDKLLIARKLDEFGIHYIEGGFPLSNPKEEQFFARLAQEKLKNSILAAFGSTRRASQKPEEDAGLRALLACGAPVLTIVGKSWDLHVKEVLRCSLEDNLQLCADSVAYLKKQGRRVFFDAEHFFDGYKNNPEYALKVLQAAAEAGAEVLVLCETNGGCLPNEVFDITQVVCRTLSGAVVGIHTHNDSDCAVANSLAAVQAGARQVQGTINGLGERSGNANLCSIIPNLTLKMGYETVGLSRLKGLTELSRFVFEVANLPPVSNLPYVGESAFAHKGGLHIDALRKNEKTYEHIHPSLVGNERKYLISELSGSSNVLDKLERKKITADKQTAAKILKAVQDLENAGYQFETAEASFDLLVKKTLGEYVPSFELIKYHIDVERNPDGAMVTEATVKLQVDGKVEHVVAEGDGPVNALDNALRKALERFYPSLREMSLVDYKVRVVNAKAGTAARVRVVIESRDRADLWGTVGVSENIIEASWLALVDSVEYKLLKDADKFSEQSR
ncbi:MAG TPA: citramalate synthase [Anaerohalosphaeraceae bacterium]|nr:citramalate synthase [Anaerohalosphaeraceae bacterium]